jgi:hypothetical protein
MDRKTKRIARRTLKNRAVLLAKIIVDPKASADGCNVQGLLLKLAKARRDLRRLSY